MILRIRVSSSIFVHDDDFDDSVNQLSMNAAIVIVEYFQYDCHVGFYGVHYMGYS